MSRQQSLFACTRRRLNNSSRLNASDLFQVDPRFLSLFSVFNMTFPSEESLIHIYESILLGHTIPFTDEVKGCVKAITK